MAAPQLTMGLPKRSESYSMTSSGQEWITSAKPPELRLDELAKPSGPRLTDGPPLLIARLRYRGRSFAPFAHCMHSWTCDLKNPAQSTR